VTIQTVGIQIIDKIMQKRMFRTTESCSTSGAILLTFMLQIMGLFCTQLVRDVQVENLPKKVNNIREIINHVHLPIVKALKQ
jgi:hypothetical protein